MDLPQGGLVDGVPQDAGSGSGRDAPTAEDRLGEDDLVAGGIAVGRNAMGIARAGRQMHRDFRDIHTGRQDVGDQVRLSRDRRLDFRRRARDPRHFGKLPLWNRDDGEINAVPFREDIKRIHCMGPDAERDQKRDAQRCRIGQRPDRQPRRRAIPDRQPEIRADRRR